MAGVTVIDGPFRAFSNVPDKSNMGGIGHITIMSRSVTSVLSSESCPCFHLSSSLGLC